MPAPVLDAMFSDAFVSHEEIEGLNNLDQVSHRQEVTALDTVEQGR